MAPSTEDDVYFVENHLKDVRKSIYTYIDVLKMGIKKGGVSLCSMISIIQGLFFRGLWYNHEVVLLNFPTAKL